MGTGTQGVEARRRVLLSPEVVRHLLWHFGETNRGTEPGRFVARLLVLIAAADDVNRDRLSEHWPEYVAGYEVVVSTRWGLDWLRGLADAERAGDESALLPLAEAVQS